MRGNMRKMSTICSGHSTFRNLFHFFVKLSHFSDDHVVVNELA